MYVMVCVLGSASGTVFLYAKWHFLWLLGGFCAVSWSLVVFTPAVVECQYLPQLKRMVILAVPHEMMNARNVTLGALV